MIELKSSVLTNVCLLITDAASGWVAIGFGQDKLMGDDAVVMATASELTLRWNIGTTGSVHDSIETEDIGIINEMVQVRIHWFITSMVCSL